MNDPLAAHGKSAKRHPLGEAKSFKSLECENLTIIEYLRHHDADESFGRARLDFARSERKDCERNEKPSRVERDRDLDGITIAIDHELSSSSFFIPRYLCGISASLSSIVRRIQARSGD